MKVTIIRADGEVEDVEMENELDAFQSAVGGYIETVPLKTTNGIGIINEEGKLEGLPRNLLATEIAGPLFAGDYIAGTMVVVGPIDGDGNFTDAPDDLTFPVRPDIQVRNEGTIVLFDGVSSAGEAWLAEHLFNTDGEPMKFGRAFVVEHRYAGDILEGALADGLEVRT